LTKIGIELINTNRNVTRWPNDSFCLVADQNGSQTTRDTAATHECMSAAINICIMWLNTNHKRTIIICLRYLVNSVVRPGCKKVIFTVTSYMELGRRRYTSWDHTHLRYSVVISGGTFTFPTLVNTNVHILVHVVHNLLYLANKCNQMILLSHNRYKLPFINILVVFVLLFYPIDRQRRISEANRTFLPSFLNTFTPITPPHTFLYQVKTCQLLIVIYHLVFSSWIHLPCFCSGAVYCVNITKLTNAYDFPDKVWFPDSMRKWSIREAIP
jgi:hypothetical protein